MDWMRRSDRTSDGAGVPLRNMSISSRHMLGCVVGFVDGQLHLLAMSSDGGAYIG